MSVYLYITYASGIKVSKGTNKGTKHTSWNDYVVVMVAHRI